MELLLQAGACPHAWISLPGSESNEYKELLLVFIAAMESKRDIMKLLISHVARNDNHESYFTPLYAAVSQNDYDLAKKLLKFEYVFFHLQNEDI